LAGQVIGINTAIATNRDAYDGVGFAIPSNTVRQVYNSIVSQGQVSRGAIGVTFTNGKNTSVLRSFGADHGVVVDSVQPGSPAERAGLRLGDVITSVDSRPVADGDDLLGVVSQTAPGARLRVDFLRESKPQTTEVVVGDWNKIVGEVEHPPDPSGENSGEGKGGALGVSVRALNADQERELTRALRLPNSQGVLVTEVVPGSFGDDLGLGHWDVILSINRQPVASVDDFNRLQSQLKSGDNVLLLVARRGGGSFTTLFLADRLP
jgi:serine protease Do